MSAYAPAASVFGFDFTGLDGTPQSISQYAGKVLLIVNVASKCGYTPQYAGLEELWRDYRERGLVVLGFPCDQFGHQEPGDADAIREFCSLNYEVSFPLAEKIEVNGSGAHPLWKWLKQQQPGVLGTKAIKWNFSKFLIGRDGRVIARHAPGDTPESLRSAIEAALDEPAPAAPS